MRDKSTAGSSKHVGPNMLGSGGVATGQTRRGRNPALLEDKEVVLTGPDRAFIARAVERVPSSARTEAERELLHKVLS